MTLTTSQFNSYEKKTQNCERERERERELVSSHGEYYANECYRFIFVSTRCRGAKIDAEFVREADLYRDV